MLGADWTTVAPQSSVRDVKSGKIYNRYFRHTLDCENQKTNFLKRKVISGKELSVRFLAPRRVREELKRDGKSEALEEAVARSQKKERKMSLLYRLD